MEIEQHIGNFTSEGEAVVVYTLRNGQGAEVQITNLGATVVAPDLPALFPAFATHIWESGVQTNWVVMALDAGEHHLEAGFYLYDDNTLEITTIENGIRKVESVKV